MDCTFIALTPFPEDAARFTVGRTALFVGFLDFPAAFFVAICVLRFIPCSFTVNRLLLHFLCATGS